MTITISEQAYTELLQEVDQTTQHFDPSDPLDVTWQYPKLIGQGFIRCIKLREGLQLHILDARLHHRLIIDCPERLDWLRYHFHISGQHEDKYTTVGNREYALYGSGLAPKELVDGPEQQALEVTVGIHPQVLCSFISSPSGQLPTEFQPLVYSSQECSACGFTSPTNRDGEKFICEECGHHDDADIDAGLVIADRTRNSIGLPNLPLVKRKVMPNPKLTGDTKKEISLPLGREPGNQTGKGEPTVAFVQLSLFDSYLSGESTSIPLCG